MSDISAVVNELKSVYDRIMSNRYPTEKEKLSASLSIRQKLRKLSGQDMDKIHEMAPDASQWARLSKRLVKNALHRFPERLQELGSQGADAAHQHGPLQVECTKFLRDLSSLPREQQDDLLADEDPLSREQEVPHQNMEWYCQIVRYAFDFDKLENLAKSTEATLREKLEKTRDFALAAARLPNAQQRSLLPEHPMLRVYYHTHKLLAASDRWLNAVSDDPIVGLMHRLALFHALVVESALLEDAKMAAAKDYERLKKTMTDNKCMDTFRRQPLFTMTPTPATFIEHRESAFLAQFALRARAIARERSRAPTEHHEHQAKSRQYLEDFSQFPSSWRRTFFLMNDGPLKHDDSSKREFSSADGFTKLKSFRIILETAVDLTMLKKELPTEAIDSFKKLKLIKFVARVVPSLPRDVAYQLFQDDVLVAWHQLILGGTLGQDIETAKDSPTRLSLPERTRNYMAAVDRDRSHGQNPAMRISDYFLSFQYHAEDVFARMPKVLNHTKALTVDDYVPYFEVLSLLSEMEGQASTKGGQSLVVVTAWSHLTKELQANFKDESLLALAGVKMLEKAVSNQQALSRIPLTAEDSYTWSTVLFPLYRYTRLFPKHDLPKEMETKIKKLLPAEALKSAVPAFGSKNTRFSLDFCACFVFRFLWTKEFHKELADLDFGTYAHISYWCYCDSPYFPVAGQSKESSASAIEIVVNNKDKKWVSNSRQLADLWAIKPGRYPGEQMIFQITVACRELAMAYWKTNADLPKDRKDYLRALYYLLKQA